MQLPLDKYQQFNQWLTTPMGQQVLRHELQAMQIIMENLHGNHLLLLGSPAYESVEKFGYFSHFWQQDLAVLDKRLSFDDETFNAIIIPHCLSFVDQPDLIIKELGRLLQGEGHLLFCGFNPYGRLFDTRSWWKKWLQQPNFGLRQLDHCLVANDFSILTSQRYRCRVNKQLQCRTLPRNWGVSDDYLCLAHKRTEAMKPKPLVRQKTKATALARVRSQL